MDETQAADIARRAGSIAGPLPPLTGPCCDNGRFEEAHTCRKQPGAPLPDTGRNGAGIERAKLGKSPGRPPGIRGPLNSKHPSSMGRKFLKAGLDWQTDFALAIKGNKRERIKLWLRLLPYLVTTHNVVKVKKWKGKASKAALIALQALEGKNTRGEE
jgi:hypothetical protein